MVSTEFSLQIQKQNISIKSGDIVQKKVLNKKGILTNCVIIVIIIIFLNVYNYF